VDEVGRGSNDDTKGGGCWSRKLGWEGIYGGLDFAPPSIVMSGRRGGEAEGQTTR
jgi:hypothetical protein